MFLSGENDKEKGSRFLEKMRIMESITWAVFYLLFKRSRLVGKLWSKGSLHVYPRRRDLPERGSERGGLPKGMDPRRGKWKIRKEDVVSPTQERKKEKRLKCPEQDAVRNQKD